MRLDITHFYNMRGWDVLIANSEASKHPAAIQAQSPPNVNNKNDILPKNPITECIDKQLDRYS